MIAQTICHRFSSCLVRWLQITVKCRMQHSTDLKPLLEDVICSNLYKHLLDRNIQGHGTIEKAVYEVHSGVSYIQVQASMMYVVSEVNCENSYQQSNVRIGVMLCLSWKHIAGETKCITALQLLSHHLLGPFDFSNSMDG